jgi:tRNA-2-methylthio-N6-dimethylallyladenosine synthase
MDSALSKTATTISSIKTFHVRTYGCQMNELDSEVMAGILKQRGLEQAENEELADLLIFNTCSVRDLAERKALGKIGRLTSKISSRGQPKRQIIGVTGCMANAKKDKLLQKVPHIDFVLGTNNIHELNQVLDDVLLNNSQPVHVDPRFEHELDYQIASRDDGVKAYVSIIRGCDKYCTYCIVPYTRGPEVSLHPDDIIKECESLITKGYKEITLLGQNVNSYGKDRPEWNTLFHDLLYKIDNISTPTGSVSTRLERIRFMTSHPVDITPELMYAIRDLPTLCEFVHFPLQAGSNRILKKMHRLYTKEEYFEKVRLLRSIAPKVKLGTDIIVGFPTETEEEFMETYNAMKELRFSVAFIFAYSPRKGTPATRWKDDVPEEVKADRLQRLLQLQEEINAEERDAMLGEVVEVLVERPSIRDDIMLKGRTRCWKSVLFPGSASLVGSLQRVKINSYTKQTLMGQLVDGPADTTCDYRTGSVNTPKLPIIGQ